MSDSEYLSPGELHDFTGYARAGQQTAWLIVGASMGAP